MVPYIVKAFTKDGTEIEDFEDFYNTLWNDMIKSKYQYHHVFKVGDLLFMDQLNTIHRRSPIKDKDRQLWRTAFDYSNFI
jgi:alpha-ketoglutarate-dependent taurine dioxygenase